MGKRQEKIDVEPDAKSILRSLNECKELGREAFLVKHASGHHPHTHYVRFGDEDFPLKAIWAAAHTPPVHTREFKTGDAKRGLKRFGYEFSQETRISN